MVIFPSATKLGNHVHLGLENLHMHNHYTKIFLNNSYLGLKNHTEARHLVWSDYGNHASNVANSHIDIHNNVYQKGDVLEAKHPLDILELHER